MVDATGFVDGRAAAAVDVLLRGLSMLHGGEEMLAISGALFDGLYECRERAVLIGREPS